METKELEQFLCIPERMNAARVPDDVLTPFIRAAQADKKARIGYDAKGIGWFVVIYGNDRNIVIKHLDNNGQNSDLVRFPKKYGVDEVLRYVDVTAKGVERNYDGNMVWMHSDRYKCFKLSGIKCVKCGLEGKYFCLERNHGSNRSHFNLYAVANDGKEILMTKDHIIPKSLGGKDAISNYQTMCALCNVAKGNSVGATEIT